MIFRAAAANNSLSVGITSNENAQEGRGVKRPAERAGESLSSLAARSRALRAKQHERFETLLNDH